MRKILAAAALALSIPAQSGVLHTAIKSDSQVTMSRNETGITSCGIRVASFIQPGRDVRWYDFSLSIYREQMAGLLKAGSYTIDVETLNKKGLPKDPRTIARTPIPTGFWVADVADKPPAAMKNIIPSPDKGFILGQADFSRIAELSLAIAKGDAAQFSVKYSEKGVDDVVNFKAPLSPDDLKTLVDCYSGLHNGLKSDIEASEKK